MGITDGNATEYAIPLDCYSHSGEVWAISGSQESLSFPDQLWDVGHGVGVWIPDEYLLKDIQNHSTDENECEAFARKCAQEALEEYNAWCSGDIYGVVTEAFHNIDRNTPLRDDRAYNACWGYFGYDHAMRQLKNDMVAACKTFFDDESKKSISYS
jgi:hypothetical protein